MGPPRVLDWCREEQVAVVAVVVHPAVEDDVQACFVLVEFPTGVGTLPIRHGTSGSFGRCRGREAGLRRYQAERCTKVPAAHNEEVGIRVRDTLRY